MNTPIQVYSRNVYGTPRTYVSDPVIAQAIQTLTGSETLAARHVSALMGLGFTFEQVIDPEVAKRARYGATLTHSDPTVALLRRAPLIQSR